MRCESDKAIKKLIIIGASGHGKVVADIAAKSGYTEIAFFDDNEAVKSCMGYPVIGKTAELERYTENEFFVAIGNPEIRKGLQRRLLNRGIEAVTLIHPDAVIASHVSIGTGTAVMAGAIINPGSKIGAGCIVNTGATVDHDNDIGDFVHVSVGAHLAGSVTVGDCTWIGAGAVVSNNINICGGCMIGAGAVVIRDIKESGTYVGVPARLR